MAKLKKLSDIKKGSIVRYDGEKWEVQQTSTTALIVKRSDHTKVIIGADTLLTVLAEPAESSLTDLLKNQVKKQSLTDSLRHQVDAQEDEEDECDDWEEDEDCGCEEVNECTDCASAQVEAGLDAQARLNASVASRKAGKAQFQAQVATAGVNDLKGHQASMISRLRKLHDEIETIGEDQINGFERVERDLEDTDNVANAAYEHAQEVGYELNDVVAQANNVFGEFDSRITKLEEKEKMKLKNELQAQLNAKLQNKSNKGGMNMKNVLGKFKGLFGKVEGVFALSPAGIALRKGIKQEFVVFDRESGTITDVDSMVLDFEVPAFRLPVEAAEIKVGQIVLSNNDYGYVTEVVEDGEYVKVTYPAKASQGTVLPVTNFLFGKPFYTVVQTLDIAAQDGGFNPALLLAMGKGNKDDILPFLAMSGGLGGDAGAIDPTMLMMLGDSVDELLPLLLMQQGGVTKEGFNPLMMLALSDKGGSKKDSLLPLLMMQGQGGQAGGINPMMLMMMGDGDIDPMTLMMMGGFGGQGANPFGNLFGTPQKVTPKTKKEDK